MQKYLWIIYCRSDKQELETFLLNLLKVIIIKAEAGTTVEWSVATKASSAILKLRTKKSY